MLVISPWGDEEEVDLTFEFLLVFDVDYAF
jgi:hypothetical protein